MCSLTSVVSDWCASVLWWSVFGVQPYIGGQFSVCPLFHGWEMLSVPPYICCQLSVGPLNLWSMCQITLVVSARFASKLVVSLHSYLTTLCDLLSLSLHARNWVGFAQGAAVRADCPRTVEKCITDHLLPALLWCIW